MFIFDFSADIQAVLNQFWWQINFFLIIILFVLGYFSVKKPLVAVCLTIALLPTYLFRSKIGFVPFTYLELCLLITFFGWLFGKWQMANSKWPIAKSKERMADGEWQMADGRWQRANSEEQIAKSKWRRANGEEQMANGRWKIGNLPIILILLASAISIFFSPNLSAGAGIWKAYFLEPILFFIVVINVAKNDHDRENILWALGLAALPIIFLAIYQKFTAFGIAEPGWILASQRRVTSIFSSPNAVGLLIGPITLIYSGWVFDDLKNIGKTLIKIFFIIFALLALVFTVSQGTWLGLAAGLAFVLFFAWNKKLTIILLTLIAIICLGLPPIQNKIFPILTFQDASGQNRIVLWQMAQNYLLASPKNFIFGAGLNGFAQIQNQLRDPLKMEPLLYPHNIFLNFWLETGLLGLIGLVWIMVRSLKKLFLDANLRIISYRLGLAAALIGLIIHGLIDVPYFKNDLAVLFWIIIGLI